MKHIHTTLGLGLLLATAPSLLAATVAYWRFEEGPAAAPVSHGGQPDGVFHPGTLDSSGNNNHLSVWAEGWAGYAYALDRPATTVPATGAANNFAVVNTGSYPAMSTQTGIPLQTWTPSSWTIEVAFQPENGGHRTLVGRDSQGANTQTSTNTPLVPAGVPVTLNPDGNLAALYLQIQPDNSLAIKYCDVAGYWHEAISPAATINGYTYPNSAAGTWYAAAAVCNGSLLSLYLRNVEANGAGAYQLVAQTDLTTSGSPNRALSAGTGDGGDWDAGNFSVGRGMYAGGHGDRAYGFIDEVRISDTALTPGEFLFVPEPGTALLGGLGLLGLLRRRQR